jgi:hypothetical protein
MVQRELEPSYSTSVFNALLGGGLEAERDELRNEAAPSDGLSIPPILLAKL